MILVTGGTGFVGTHLANALLRRGHEVAVLARRPGASRNRYNRPVESVPGDVLDFQWFQLYSTTNGGMRLTFAFTDAGNGQLESHDNNVSGDSPGWRGSVLRLRFRTRQGS